MVNGTTISMSVRVSILGFLLWLLYRLVRSKGFMIREDQERAKPLRGQLIGCRIAFILLWPFASIRLHQCYRSQVLYCITRPLGRTSMLAALLLCVLFLNSACKSGYPKLADVSKQEFPVVFSIAEQLGYMGDDLLVQANQCTVSNLAPPPFPSASSCGIFVAFETEMTRNEFGTFVAELAFERTDTYQDEGTGLFELLNLSDHITGYRRLKIKDSEGQDGKEQETLPDIIEYSWQFKYTEERFLYVEFYNTSLLEPSILLDDQIIEENVAIVYLRLGTVQTWPE